MKKFIFLNNKENKEDLISKIEITLSCVILLFLWQIIAIKLNNNIFLPTIGEVIKSMMEISTQERFYLDITASMARCIFSFVYAMLFAFILGVLAYISRVFRNLLKPISALVSSIPTMVLVVLALIWFEKDNAPFVVGFAIVFPILYDSVLSALLNIDRNLIEMLSLYKINTKDKILKVYLPSIKFQLVPILVSTFSLALKVVIAGEVHGQPTYGIGTMIQIEKINFNTPGIFAWIIIIILISIILEIVQRILVRRTFIWKR